MNLHYLSVAAVSCFANDNDALIPELWSQMGLVILEENMVAARLCHRDFENEIRNYGDVVNTRRPGRARIRRRKDGVNVEQQDAVATNVRVPLDQWFYSSFTIKDGEASMSFQDLVQLHLLPHSQNIARAVDRALVGRVHAFLGNKVGKLGKLDGTNAKDYALEAREKLNVNNVPGNPRSLLLSPSSDTAFLKQAEFLKANERGDGGSALESALLGRILGFDTYMGQNTNSVSGNCDKATGTVTNALAAEGSGSQATDINGYNVIVGEYAVVEGDNQPNVVSAVTLNGADTDAVTLVDANKYATLAGAAITIYKSCDVKGAFSAGHIEHVIVDGHTANKGPQVGQLIAFGTGGSRKVYTVIEIENTSTTETKIWLDRPLESALVDDQAAFPGPEGSFNWAFYKDAIALVTRPLALPDQAMGVKAGIATHNGVSMRVTMQYSLTAGGTLVNMDILAGVAVLDEDMAVVLLG